MAQGEFSSPEHDKEPGAPTRCYRVGHGGSDLLKLDDALASVDNFVAEKLG